MAIYRVINGKRYTLNGVIDYTRDSIRHANQIIATGGYWVSISNPTADMEYVKALYNKHYGKEYIHIILSLDNDEKPNQLDANNLFDEYAHSIYISTGCQVYYSIHGNTNNLHCHYIINTVRMADGNKIQFNFATFYALRNEADLLLFKYGLKPIKIISA